MSRASRLKAADDRSELQSAILEESTPRFVADWHPGLYFTSAESLERARAQRERVSRGLSVAVPDGAEESWQALSPYGSEDEEEVL